MTPLLISPPLRSRAHAQRLQRAAPDMRRRGASRQGTTDVMAQRADSSFARQRPDRPPYREIGRKSAGYQAGRDGLHIALHSRDLSREEQIGFAFQLQRGRQQRRSVDVSIAMNLSEANEFRV